MAGANILVLLFRKFGVVGLLVGGAAMYFMGGLGSGPSALTSGTEGAAPADLDAEKPMVEFVSFVFDDVQNSWPQPLATAGEQYQLARLVLFRGQTPSACGTGQAAMGPFYCPGDEKVYIDLSFYAELRQRFGAPGDFAQAYVIAHEVGHHVQHLLGTSERVHRAPESQQRGERGLLVRLELQADCFAGVWAHSTEQRKLLEAGDIDEALRAAQVIGDDALQRGATGTVRPETFTHGTSAQRARWFGRGYETGRIDACDTFSATAL